MKKSLSLVLVLLFASLGLIAQSSGMPAGHQMLFDPDKFADGHVAALDRQLQLTNEQKTKLRPVFLEEGKQLLGIISSTTLSQEEKQAAIGKLHLETANQVNSLLTPEQRRQGAPSLPKAHPATQT